jgi:hypothetical protein
MDWIYINYAFIQIYVRFHSQLRFLFQEQCLGNEHDCTRNSSYFLMKRNNLLGNFFDLSVQFSVEFSSNFYLN